MRCPALAELPPPPPGKTGWPWTEESEQLPDTMANGSPWPRVSIVTPSYNQEQFIEKTIRSVLLQGYPSLEYIIIDGGSGDGSVEIIRKYEPWLAYWVSELDEGQPHAINKGLNQATGHIIAYLNSDDFYEPDAFARAVRHFRGEPSHQWLIGTCRYVTDEGDFVRDFVVKHPAPGDPVAWVMREGWGHPQASTFWRRDVFSQCGYFREDMDYAFDTEHGVRSFFADMPPLIVPELLATRTLHEDCKTVKNPGWFSREKERLLEIYGPQLTATERKRAYVIRFKRDMSSGSGRRGLSALRRLCSAAIRERSPDLIISAARLVIAKCLRRT